MQVNVATYEDIQGLKKEIIDEIKKLFAEDRSAISRKWLKSNEVRRMLKVSPGTLQNLRVNGTLPFTKIGGVIFYDFEDITRMLDTGKRNEPFHR